MRDSTRLAWRELAKDGATFSDARRAVRPAIHQISIGETLDVEITPDTPGDLRVDVRIGGNFPGHPLLATPPIRVVARGQ